MTKGDQLERVAAKVEAAFAERQVVLTLGGEPTFVPIDPVGPEWSVTALGPTKLRYAYALTEALITHSLRNAVPFYSPGKTYPGEVNPRWAIQVIWNRDDSPLVPALLQLQRRGRPTAARIEAFKSALLRALRIKSQWIRAIDARECARIVWVLPLDHDDARFRSDDWALGESLSLLSAEGPSGLRLPLHLIPEGISGRALTIESQDGRFCVFLPPLLQAPFLELIGHIVTSSQIAKLGPVDFAGYLPYDQSGRWNLLGIAADPGVIEVNLPPCHSWKEYHTWMRTLEKASESAGLRTWKLGTAKEAIGTGGGNHLLFGGPTPEANPLFTHPSWITSMLRYWQHHPSLAYLFTGQYVGASSQAPRPDECASALYDLEMAYQFLEQLPAGDHRYLLSETLRHLHTDGGGNTHRSEISFDKFWNVSFDGGCRGLLEFRAVESLPCTEWMSAVALLWRALAAYLLVRPFTAPLVDHGERLHDHYFLPTCLWADFEIVLRDLRKAGFDLPVEIYRAIADWRFPTLLTYFHGDAKLAVRRALEGWPLLCETPLEGGTTSRFVDTSIERLEFTADPAFGKSCRLRVQGRRLDLETFPKRKVGTGFRYRRSALHPSLHPGIAPHLPLLLSIESRNGVVLYKLDGEQQGFQPCDDKPPKPDRRPCQKLHPNLLTRDLRLP
ncbi:MAG TPA: transglutaminase family protein [Chthoniobacteraceae bacterium]|jgi:uncharacterized protein (DUF2126 family)|nr:transglutaminase family protein [Chthoniobacteraceae bacterium]